MIPVLLGVGASLIAGAKSVHNYLKAADLEENAEEMIENAKEALKLAREKSTASLEVLSDKKDFVLEGSFKRFITTFEKLQNVDVDNIFVLEELNKFKENKQYFKKLKDNGSYDTSIAKEVFQLILTGPVLSLLFKSGKELDLARIKYAQAEEIVEEIEAAMDGINAIRRRSYLFLRLLIRLDAIFSPMVYQLDEVIKKSGTDYNRFSQEDKKLVAGTMAMATSVKAVLDTPILTKKGKLTKTSRQIASDIRSILPSQAVSSNDMPETDNNDEEETPSTDSPSSMGLIGTILKANAGTIGAFSGFNGIMKKPEANLNLGLLDGDLNKK
jgi:hypothetical protein